MAGGCRDHCRIGAGLSEDERHLPRSLTRGATSSRNKVTVTLLGGDDVFEIGDDTRPITLPFSISLGTGNDSAEGAGGADTMQGGSGNDTLRGEGGDDVIDGSVGNDTLFLGTGADNANGSDGDDVIVLATQNRDETDQVNGGVGADTATYTEAASGVGPNDRLTPLRFIEANLETLAGLKDSNENDVLEVDRALRRRRERGHHHRRAVLERQPLLRRALRRPAVRHERQQHPDRVGRRGSARSARPATTRSTARSGSRWRNRTRRSTAGRATSDHAVIDLKDAATVGCEDTDRSAIGEGPHVRLKFGRAVAVVGGGVAARLDCPRKLRHRCAGTLELRLGKRHTSRTRYAIKAGHSRRVVVRLGALGSRVGGHTVGQLLSLEQGDVKGLKTTSRRIVLVAPGG